MGCLSRLLVFIVGLAITILSFIPLNIGTGKVTLFSLGVLFWIFPFMGLAMIYGALSVDSKESKEKE
jgi:hypothetical protein